MTAAGPDLTATFADLVARLRRAMRRAARAKLPTLPLSVAQLELLSVVEERPGSRPGELALALRLAPNSVSTLANTLATAGMLQRAASTADKRAVEYSLTPAGAAHVASWRQVNGTALAAAVEALPVADQEVLGRALPVLDRLVDLLEEQTDRTDDHRDG
ncbi:MarR family transcriptional regulator [Phycicoccus sp. M110.8]|uniref:MarR family winged helix-turn-helix transcriptional regulator n=1 Tax=Phycicoccus sp. M110.8 TaxID=3075433 RepID=UPI0028FD3E75|nr:MarR family transcriptional regulator [Phycicoccus sp. M110.8]MDU0315344.1 MarR family transcriptional regulator [Phycicoccus sp. M110.8]